ncbi:MAG: hypothetical protein ACO1OB_20015, partial [Archangium sp.]
PGPERLSVTSLLLALALAAAPDAGVKPAPPFEWDVPGLLEAVPIGQKMERGGLPLKMFLAHSSWELDRLLIHYTARFADAGYFIPARMGRLPGLKLPRLVALDDTNMMSFLVYGWPEKDGSTTLVLGAADLGHRKPASANGLPIFPGATGATRFNLEDATALSFRATATQDEVIDFYRSVLPSGGWKEREPGTFVHEGRAVRVLARKQGKALSVVVLEQRDDGPEERPVDPR